MHWHTLKLAFSLVATLYLPLNVLADCPARTVVQPRNKEFLSICAASPDAPDVGKTDQYHPCFRLNNGNLHDVQVYHKTLKDDGTHLIVKDGDLIDFTLTQGTTEASIYWPETGWLFIIQPSKIHGVCFDTWLVRLPTSASESTIKKEQAKATSSGTSDFRCEKWNFVDL
ncbi:uncharacterized protein UTRI_02635 [Ustilago trichophora]|uniref:Mig1 protein n=1 Tax=Ustilago trichophora TaxID=86804 RepID=A0A5C3ENG1_9BASI|nr:uncharacterized protein UTRI_02635 [Ustilago trichophora]